jgi:hypothetical protein
VYTGHGVFEALEERKFDVPLDDEDKITNHLIAIGILKECGLKGVGVIGAYHARGLAPLMRHALPLLLMALDASQGRRFLRWPHSMKRSAVGLEA